MARRRIPSPVIYLGILVVVGALVLAVWGLGGFDRRTDLFAATAPGTTIETGPYEFTFTKATAQRRKSYSDPSGIEWKVIVLGTGRTTGDESIAPSTLNPMFGSKDPASGEYHDMEYQQIGQQGVSGGNTFTPGLPAVPYQVEFTYGPKYRPGTTVRFAAFELEYSDNSLLGTGEKLWNNTNHGYVFDLPVTVLAPET